MSRSALSSPVDCKKVKLSYIFYLNKESAVQLEEILSCFLSGKTVLGLIILVDKNSFILKELTFLGDLPYRFHKIGKPFGLWGLPYCVMQFIMGGYSYSKYIDSLIAESPLFTSVPPSWMHSALLLPCRKCIAVKECMGVGNLTVNHSMFAWRVQNSDRLKRAHTVSFDSGISAHYRAFLKHITSFSLEKTDRSIRYARAFLVKDDAKDAAVYRDRFVYYCNYLAAEEFEAEKAFICQVSENRYFVSDFFQNYRDYFKRFAFSLASGAKVRETFYGFFISDRASKDFLDRFDINIEQEEFEEVFYFFGMDFIDQTLNGYKLYAKIYDERRFFDYLRETLSFDFPTEMRAITYNYLLVRRIDNSGRLSSLKIEFLCRDFSKLLHLTERYFSIRPEINSQNRVERIAFDIAAKGTVNKITLYYAIG